MTPAPRPLSYLGFDFGTRRVGVAVGNSLLGVARALATIDAVGPSRFERIARFVDEWRPDALVIGVPFHPDGAEHENTRLARRFGRQLAGRFRLPVHEVDERYSTTEALAQGEKQVDAGAAKIILDQYLRGAEPASGSVSEANDCVRSAAVVGEDRVQ